MYNEPTDSSYARLSCRVSARIKHQAEEAAALLGQSITDFTESALADKAQAVLERHERITLSDRDFSLFVAAIEQPEQPTEALKTAMADYRSRFKPTTETGL
jgi:uncharacterized protein (DUF1778 family)